jgi:ArsR family transcriptional regulator
MTIDPSPFLPHPRWTEKAETELAAKLKALSEPLRLRILRLLSAQGPMAIAELVPELRIVKSTVMHHLKPLEAAGFVRKTTSGDFWQVDVDALAAVAIRIDPFGPRDHERRSSVAAAEVRHNATHSRTSVPHSADVTA